MTLAIAWDFQAIFGPHKDCHSGVTLKRAQILHALHMALRSVSLEALEDIETEKQKKAMDDLLAQKALVEEHFLLIVQANKGDVERATNFATLYHRSLSSWLDHEVTQLAADVRNLAWLVLRCPKGVRFDDFPVELG